MKRIKNVNDFYGVLDDWEDIKAMIEDIEANFLKFYGPTKTRAAGTRIRAKAMRMTERLQELRKKVLKQRQDYESEY